MIRYRELGGEIISLGSDSHDADKVGENFDIDNNILSAFGSDGQNLTSQIYIDTNLDLSTPGMYEIHYRVADSQGRIGQISLLPHFQVKLRLLRHFKENL